MFIILISFVCVSIFNSIEAARILGVFPFPSISHQIVFRTLTQELLKQGHEVVVITPDPAFPRNKAPQNFTEIDVHDISYNIWQNNFMKASVGQGKELNTQVEIIMRSLIEILDAQLKNQEVKAIISGQNKTFDLLLLEACAPLAIAFSHIFKVPVILVSSFGTVPGNNEIIGAPTHPILYPSTLSRKLNNLTNWEKITEFYDYYQMQRSMTKYETVNNNFLKKKFGSDVPTIKELNNNVDMLFLNINPIFHGIQPVPPNVVYMGGIHINSEKELPTDLKKYLDSSKNGVIYISFGTNVDPTLFPAEKVQTLVNVLSKLPFDVLFKWNSDILPGKTENIKIFKWLPQSDLLRHPKIKLFITQGGLQSTDEAIRAGVPLIGIPMLGDQWYNVEKYVYHRIGLRLDLDTLTEEEFKKAIDTVVEDDSYRQNIIKLRNMMLDQPMTPLELAIWWIEYVLRHNGAKHLRSPAANITWTEYLELELVYIVLAVLLSIAVIITLAVRFIYMTTIVHILTHKNKQS